MMKKLIMGIIGLSFLPQIAMAEEIYFSLGVGWTFFLTPTVSTAHKDIEYYVNFKLGLDAGFSVGAEKQFGNHVYGVFIGAVGARNTDSRCHNNDDCDFVLFEFDNESTQGLGLSYEYRFNSSREGWAFRLEAGYGEETRHNEKRFDGNVQVVYHF